MFTSTERFRRNPKSNFYDKRLLMGSSHESVASPILDCSVNPKGGLAYKLIFDMTEENQFVPGNAVCVTVTPAQLQLLELVDHLNAADYAAYLKTLHSLGTYFCSERDLVDLEASHGVTILQEALTGIALENQTLKTISQ